MIINHDKTKAVLGQAMGLTTAPVEAGSVNGVMPEFGRWQDVQRLFGIKRGTLYNLVAAGMVKSVSLRRKGMKQGCRLFYLPGISAMLKEMLECQGASPAEASHGYESDKANTDSTLLLAVTN